MNMYVCMYLNICVYVCTLMYTYAYMFLQEFWVDLMYVRMHFPPYVDVFGGYV